MKFTTNLLVIFLCLISILSSIHAKKHGKGKRNKFKNLFGKGKNRSAQVQNKAQSIHKQYKQLLQNLNTKISNCENSHRTEVRNLNQKIAELERKLSKKSSRSDLDLILQAELEELQSKSQNDDLIIDNLKRDKLSLKKSFENLKKSTQLFQNESITKTQKIQELQNQLKLASELTECVTIDKQPKSAPFLQSLQRSQSEWNSLKPKTNNYITLTWKINPSVIELPGMDITILNNWMKEITCILMSLTPVNLKQANSFENADIPISFLKRNAFKLIDSYPYTIGISDSTQLKNSTKPTAPIYINMETQCSKWRFYEDDLFLSQPYFLDLVHMKFYLLHEFIHSLGLPHNSDPKSVMYYKPTPDSLYIFKKVMKNKNVEEFIDTDRLNLAILFLTATDRIEWINKNSVMRKKWNRYFVTNHPECNKWF